jgi:hypothetical protein
MDWVKLFIRDSTLEITARREAVANRVLDYFATNMRVPMHLRAICYLDSHDNFGLRERLGGPANRGIHWPIRGQGLREWPDWPEYMSDVVARDPSSREITWPYASIIYLHATTCKTDVGLTLTLAHELQHFLQYSNDRTTWAANILLFNARADGIRVWWDLPR